MAEWNAYFRNEDDGEAQGEGEEPEGAINNVLHVFFVCVGVFAILVCLFIRRLQSHRTRLSRFLGGCFKRNVHQRRRWGAD